MLYGYLIYYCNNHFCHNYNDLGFSASFLLSFVKSSCLSCLSSPSHSYYILLLRYCTKYFTQSFLFKMTTMKYSSEHICLNFKRLVYTNMLRGVLAESRGEYDKGLRLLMEHCT